MMGAERSHHAESRRNRGSGRRRKAVKAACLRACSRAATTHIDFFLYLHTCTLLNPFCC
jgi:hypothetical protein